MRGTQNTKRESEHFRKNSRSAIPKVNKAKVETLAFDMRREWASKLDSKSYFSIIICILIAKETQATVMYYCTVNGPLCYHCPENIHNITLAFDLSSE